MGEGETWKDTLPEDIKEHPSLESFQGVEDLAKSWVEAQKLIGKDKIPVPTSPDDKEAWDVVFSRLGRPEDASGYEIPTDNIPEQIPIDEDFLENFKAKAYEVGMLPNQVNELFNWWIEAEQGVLSELGEMANSEREAAESALRKEWGRAYEQNIARAQSVVKNFAGKDAEAIMNSGFANDPTVVRFLAKIGSVISEDQLEGGGAGLTKTPDEAKQEIASIRSNANHAFYDNTNPEHAAAVKHMQDLYKLAYPE